MTPENDQIDTAYGMVNATALDALQDDYDTSGMLRIVDQLDVIRTRFNGIDGVRDDLLRLHAMAHTVLNGASLVVSRNETGIWEVADELMSEFQDWSRTFAIFTEQLKPLTGLMPQD